MMGFSRFPNTCKVAWVLATSALAFSLGCGPDAGTASSAKLDLVEVQNGFGLLLPHQVRLASANSATAPVVKITSETILTDNVKSDNPILPVATFPTTATLPSGAPGNHFISFQFSDNAEVDPASIVDPASGALTGALTVNDLDMSNPSSPVITPSEGRIFINGKTPVGGVMVDAVSLDAGGKPTFTHPVGNGFPGTTTNFSGANKLVGPNIVTFVADTDGDLQTFETFTSGVQIQIKVNSGVQATNGKFVLKTAEVTSTLGTDAIAPEIMVDTTQNPAQVEIDPGNNETGVDPASAVTIKFTEPINPSTLGSFFVANLPPQLSPSVNLTSGTQSTPTTINFPFTIKPTNGVFDLTKWTLTPALSFPALSPVSVANSPQLNFVRVAIGTGTNGFADLLVVAGTGVPGVSGTPQNSNTVAYQTDFQTGSGPGIVNAPVAPEAIYVARIGSDPGISVIDLNGFGQSTGDPTNNLDSVLDATDVSKWPFNFDFAQSGTAGEIIPPLSFGTTTLDGGSAGAFTMTKDSSLNDLLYTSVGTITDMHIGQALDQVFNNGTTAVGGSCLGGGNPCASPGKQVQFNRISNSVQFPPMPNPPGLLINPQQNCLSPQILGTEPISVSSTAGSTLMIPGDPFGTVGAGPPSGLPGGPNNSRTFEGPGTPTTSPASCPSYGTRQQIGHFLYVVDSTNDKLLVLNSNRMTLIDSIPLPDPTQLAFSPDLKILAVTNFATDTVSFVGVDPAGSNFHKVIEEVPVGKGPLGIAWQPEGEDVIVCNFSGNSISILNGQNFSVRETITNQVTRPLEVVISPRQSAISFLSNLYYAYILNGNGTVAVYESGEDTGANAWGFNTTVALVDGSFTNPVGMTVGYDLQSGAWVAHQDPNGGATISHAILTSSPTGQQPINPNATFITLPNAREKLWGVTDSIPSTEFGTTTLSDIAFDDLNNSAWQVGPVSSFTNQSNAFQDSKSLHRLGVVSQPTYMLVSSFASGQVFVIQMSSLRLFQPGGTDQFGQPIPAGQQSFDGTLDISGASILTHYWRQ